MIVSTVRLVVAAPQQSEVLRMLRVFMGHATARAGCAGFWLVHDVANPEALTICDRWLTREDLDEHVRSAEYRLLLAVIDLSVSPPEISFDALEHIGGLDVVHGLRRSQPSIAPRGPDEEPARRYGLS